MSKKNVVVCGLLVLGLVWCVVCLTKDVIATEQSYGGNYENCVELGYEKAMCKRVFEW